MRQAGRRTGSGKSLALVAVLSAGASVWAPASARGARPTEYLQHTAEFSGSELHAFTDAGVNVLVVLGDFRLRVGGRQISGQDAVAWIRTRKAGGVTRHDLTIYVEGDARVVEPGAAEVGDRTMLVVVHVQGRVTTEGAMVGGALKDYPLYGRAKAFRKAARHAERPPREPPVLIVRRTPPPARTRPADANAPTPADANAPVRPPQPPKAILPVSFHARRVTSRKRGDQRILVARGNVYLSQGAPDSDLFLEARSQSAVVFAELRPPREDVRVPAAPRLPGVQPLRPDPNRPDWRETIVGVYLEDDVVIARGERYLLGERAYYDFTTDRAIVLDAVFRTRQTQRNIPVVVQAPEARALSARELWFRDAKVSTSDFHSPTYHVGAKTAYLMDQTPYDPKGVRVGERSWRAEVRHATFNVRSVPILYWPLQRGQFTESHTALRKVQVGSHGRFGFGVETQWYLFRLLGLVAPPGFRGRLELDYYDRGWMAGSTLKYARKDFSGYAMTYGLVDRRREDNFGDEREDIDAPPTRGRLLLRHKHLLPNDWQLQLELSYLCDRNFLEQFFANEFHAGKEQETLLYAQKRWDNRAFTALMQYRMNRFDTQAESFPDLGFHVIGESLLDDTLSLYSESHAGFKRFRPSDDSGQTASRMFARLDSRNELALPLNLGPLNVVPYATGRVTYWDDAPRYGQRCRPYGQIGLRASTHLWRVFDRVDSRLWDVHRLRHILTPQVAAFVGEPAHVQPNDVYDLDPHIEAAGRRKSGYAIGLYQRLQTKRGPPGRRRTVDWMRLNVVAGFYHSAQPTLPADGRFFLYRPEHSLDRDHINAEYYWHVSDATTVLADTNWDWDSGSFRRINAGLAVRRDPRLSYYVGLRSVRDMDSTIGTVGASYRINRKYTIRGTQQYDFAYSDGENLATSISIVRKFPRWYAGLTLGYVEATDSVMLYLSLWPEGIPEVRLGSSRLDLFGLNSMN
jgi:hypothetical protein